MENKLVLIGGYVVFALVVVFCISSIVFVAHNLSGLLLTFSHGM